MLHTDLIICVLLSGAWELLSSSACLPCLVCGSSLALPVSHSLSSSVALPPNFRPFLPCPFCISSLLSPFPPFLHLSLALTCLLLSPVSRSHLSLALTCLSLSPVSRSHLSLALTCLSLSPVSRSHLSLALTCQAQSPDFAAIWLWHTPNPSPSSTTTSSSSSPTTAPAAPWTAAARLAAHTLSVTQMHFSPCDALLLSVSRDRHFCLFAATHGAADAAHALSVTQMHFSPCDTFLLSVSRGRHFCLFAAAPSAADDAARQPPVLCSASAPCALPARQPPVLCQRISPLVHSCTLRVLNGVLPTNPSLPIPPLPTNPSLPIPPLPTNPSVPIPPLPTNPSLPIPPLPTNPSLPIPPLPTNPSLPIPPLPTNPSLPIPPLPTNSCSPVKVWQVIEQPPSTTPSTTSPPSSHTTMLLATLPTFPHPVTAVAWSTYLPPLPPPPPHPQPSTTNPPADPVSAPASAALRSLLAVGLENGVIQLWSADLSPFASPTSTALHPSPSPPKLQLQRLVAFSDIHCHLAAVHRLRWRGEVGSRDRGAGEVRVTGCNREVPVGAEEVGGGRCLELASCSDDHSVRLFRINVHHL
ncbi:unnamed protein product [Closterium sp. NIES-65]|nr:unnamed protein product [Closterium sp. NIES-65]